MDPGALAIAYGRKPSPRPWKNCAVAAVGMKKGAEAPFFKDQRTSMEVRGHHAWSGKRGSNSLLRKIVGATGLLTESGDLAGHVSDWRGRYPNQLRTGTMLNRETPWVAAISAASPAGDSARALSGATRLTRHTAWLSANVMVRLSCSTR